VTAHVVVVDTSRQKPLTFDENIQTSRTRNLIFYQKNFYGITFLGTLRLRAHK